MPDFKDVASEIGEAAMAALQFIEASSDAFPPLKCAAATTINIVNLVQVPFINTLSSSPIDFVQGFKSNEQDWQRFGDFVLGATLRVARALPKASGPKSQIENDAGKLMRYSGALTAHL